MNTGLTQVLADGTNTYLYGNGRIAQASSTTEYFLGDALGSVRQLADSAGAVTLTQSYAPYGETVSSVGTGSSVYQFTGESRDANGLTYLRARYLDSRTGRFIQRDPSRLEANLYLYAGANPVMNVDPSGYWYKELVDHELWAVKQPGDTWHTLFAFVGINFEGYRGNLGPAPNRYFWKGPEPAVIIVCGKDIVCSPGNEASLDLYEAWGDKVKRVGLSKWTSGIKWSMAYRVQGHMRDNKFSETGPVYIVGHSAGGDAAIAYLSIMSPDEKAKIGGVLLIDPTLSAGWSKEAINDFNCPDAINYPKTGSMKDILGNSGLGRNRLTIYDSNMDGYNLGLGDFALSDGTDKYTYRYEEGMAHNAMASDPKIYNFSTGIFQPYRWR